jgi:hypothetical protein
MKSEAAEQVAAPAELRNTQLAPGTQQALIESGWKVAADTRHATHGGELPFLGVIEEGTSL